MRDISGLNTTGRGRDCWNGQEPTQPSASAILKRKDSVVESGGK